MKESKIKERIKEIEEQLEYIEESKIDIKIKTVYETRNT